MNGDETNNFEILLSRGSGDLNFVANLSVQERPADRRGGGDEPLFGVGFLGANQFVLDLDVFIGVEDEDARAVAARGPWGYC